jgi:protease-4
MENKQGTPPILKIAGIGIVVLIICIICAFCSFMFLGFASSLSANLNEETVRSGNENEKVAVIKIEGIITSQDQVDFFGNIEEDMVTKTINQIEKAKNDENIKAVILRINSPGGEVYGTQLIYNELLELKEEKPIIALMDSTAASGGYYIAAPANKIVANQSTITGSIGVLLQVQDLEGLYEKLGIKTYTVTNSEGDLKILDNQNLSDEESKAYGILESVLDDTYDVFVDAIEQGRPLTREEVIELSDGRIYSGRQAQENGLVDELGYLEKAIELAGEEAELEDPKVVRFSEIDSRFTNVSNKIENIFSPINLENKDEDQAFSIEYRLP